MKEKWKVIIGFDRYKVSNFGKVSGIKKEFLKPSNHEGYYTVSLAASVGKYVKRPVHRLVLEAFKEKPENKTECNHIDGNKLNNHINNLEWVTRFENMQHAATLGRLTPPIGKRWGGGRKSKLSTNDVKRIRKLAKHRVRLKIIANHFEITPQYVRQILKRISRKDVQ